MPKNAPIIRLPIKFSKQSPIRIPNQDASLDYKSIVFRFTLSNNMMLTASFIIPSPNKIL